MCGWGVRMVPEDAVSIKLTTVSGVVSLYCLEITYRYIPTCPPPPLVRWLEGNTYSPDIDGDTPSHTTITRCITSFSIPLPFLYLSISTFFIHQEGASKVSIMYIY
jgi:hypothetical protein